MVRRDSAVARPLCGARLPHLQTTDRLDWKSLGGIERPQLAQLATCEYIEFIENVAMAGPIRIGKTHLAIPLGLEAVQRRQRAPWPASST